MNVNEFLKITRGKNGLCPRLFCVDGFSMSIQVSSYHYCRPRTNDASYYDEVEIGYPSQLEPDIFPYAETEDYLETVYGYVPIEIVAAIIENHGGIMTAENNRRK